MIAGTESALAALHSLTSRRKPVVLVQASQPRESSGRGGAGMAPHGLGWKSDDLLILWYLL